MLFQIHRYRQRANSTYETGLTMTGLAWKHWFGLFDYRLVIDTSGVANAVITHMLLLRLEARD
jgi:hypothetical protein